MNRKQIENRIHRKLREYGWLVQRAFPVRGGWVPDQAYWDPAYLRRHGFHPRTIIDVGVAKGTPELYQAFPDAYLVLVEPLAEFEEPIRSILDQRAGIHIPAAAGAVVGERELQVEPRWTERSSFYSRHALEVTGDPVSTRPTPVVTIDSLATAHEWPDPIGLKIDAEGAELEILNGATSTLKRCEFVIAEVSVLPRFSGGYTFADLIAMMDHAGFAACDLLGIGRADTSEVTFIDLLFRQRSDIS